MSHNHLEFIKEISVNQMKIKLFSLKRLEEKTGKALQKLPNSIKILLEQALRHQDDVIITKKDVQNLIDWPSTHKSNIEVPFKPSRVVLQDFTGVPALVDLAALRSAMAEMNADPALIEPQIPVDLIIDHSIQVDFFGTQNSLVKNMDLEFERNLERYEFLKWGQNAFEQLTIYPPGMGIIHQVNLEHLADVVHESGNFCYPDTLVGTDSHTTMINGLGVLGWGVGGIEAEAAMLGQPIYLRMPEVVGFKLIGEIPKGATATDLVLRIVEILRQKGVVEKFVEFHGPGLSGLSLADRATIANMAPEYGATMGFFPVDSQTLNYLLATGRSESQVNLVEAYCREQGLFRTDESPEPIFSDQVELDLSTIVPSLAGPKRPQDRIELQKMKQSWKRLLTAPISDQGFKLQESQLANSGKVAGEPAFELKHGSVVIAAITSCTNTSNPSVMLAAGLLAQKALSFGLTTKPWVKTSLAPGSRVVTDYLENANLGKPLSELGFHTVGYGCTTCIGNSGPLAEDIKKVVEEKDLIVASVLSGNRNFEGRINPNTKANFLASPPLVVAYAIAGTMNIDFETEPLGKDQKGNDIFLKDLWPSNQEIQDLINLIHPEMYRKKYQDIDQVSPIWNRIKTDQSLVYDWKPKSTYIRNPPFFQEMRPDVEPLSDIIDALPLAILGDSVTTDHISPAGAISRDSPAAEYLIKNEVKNQNFNSYGSRRGNDEVMVRGTFANIRLRNLMTPEKEGGFTRHLPTGEIKSIYDAAVLYRQQQQNLIVLAGEEYGTGSSRDWAAKGTFLLGVKAVIAKSFERIHRSNLVGMGVLPLQFKEDINMTDFVDHIDKPLSIIGIDEQIQPGQPLILKQGDKEWVLICRIDTPIEIEYYKNGGILHTFLRKMT